MGCRHKQCQQILQYGTTFACSGPKKVFLDAEGLAIFFKNTHKAHDGWTGLGCPQSAPAAFPGTAAEFSDPSLATSVRPRRLFSPKENIDRVASVTEISERPKDVSAE